MPSTMFGRAEGPEDPPRQIASPHGLLASPARRAQGQDLLVPEELAPPEALDRRGARPNQARPHLQEVLGREKGSSSGTARTRLRGHDRVEARALLDQALLDDPESVVPKPAA